MSAGENTAIQTNNIAETLRKQVTPLEDEAIVLRRELGAIQDRSAEIRARLPELDSQIAGMHGAIRALTQQKRGAGRPKGSGDPDGVIESLRALLPIRESWTGAELRDAILAKGMWVGISHVSSALNSLQRQGDVERIDRGIWRWVPPERGGINGDG